MVGETGIVRHKLRNASVVSLSPARVVHFTREAVEELYGAIPTFKETLDVAASRRSGAAPANGSENG